MSPPPDARHTPPATRRRPTVGDRIFRALLGLYPRAFRNRFGSDLADAAGDRVRAAYRSGGRPAALRQWLRNVADVCASAIPERAGQWHDALTDTARVTGQALFLDPDERKGDMLDTMRNDARFAWRSILARKGFATVVILTIALGIGANTAIFSVVRGVLLRALPFADPSRIVQVQHAPPYVLVSEPEFVDYRDQVHAFARLAAYQTVTANITGTTDPEQTRVSRVSDGFFDILRPALALGRAFTPDEDHRGGPIVAMISWGFWQRRYGGARDVIGKTVELNGITGTIVGILPSHFDFPEKATDVWVPLRLNYDTLWTRNNHYLRLIGRLAPDATLPRLTSELAALTSRWPAMYPDDYAPNRPLRADVVPLPDRLLGRTRPYLLTLLAAVGFVLIIACVNVANLLLARGETRHREIAIRTALGASRGRIVRQMLTESVLYAIGGMVLALPLAWAGWRALRALAPDTIPRMDQVTLDGPVLLFTLAIAVATGLFFGIVPALRAATEEPGDTLKEAGRTPNQRRGARRVRSLLVVSEVALAAVTLTGAGLMLRSLGRLQAIDLGFRPDGALAMQVAPPPPQYAPERAEAFYRQLDDAVRGVKGVTAVGAVGDLPVADGYSVWSILIDGAPMTSVSQSPSAAPEQVTPGYFAAMGIPVVRGRAFVDADDQHAPLVAMVNEAFVKKYWPTVDPIGHTIKMLNDNSPWATVVGVVGDIRHDGYLADAAPTMYFPHTQARRSAYYTPIQMNLVVRTAGDPRALIAPVRAAVARLDRSVALSRVETLHDVVASSVASRRFSTDLLALFAALALALSAIGIYGVISYGVNERSFELGLRMALGAQRGNVVAMVLREGIVLAVAGAAAGVVGSWALVRVLMAFAVVPSVDTLLVRTSLADPATIAVVVALLLGVTAMAAWLPARRATRLDPGTTLRNG